MRILVLGAGAMGGYFGGRLIEAGADVTFLVRPRKAEQLARTGLVIKSDLGDFQSTVKTITAITAITPGTPGTLGTPGTQRTTDEAAAEFGLVILACKAYGLADAIGAITPAVERGAAVLPLLNGVRQLDLLADAFGDAAVLGGSCHIGATLGADGAIRHLNRLHTLTFGELSGERSDRVDALAGLLGGANVESRPSTTIRQDMWNKFVMLSTLAGATCLMRASVGEIMACDDGEFIVAALLDECEAVAAAEGHRPGPEFMDATRAELTVRGSTMAASMLRDMLAGGRTEGDHILGDMARRATNAGLDAPLLRAAHCRLQAYEAGHG